jgi:hypothetical protein
MTESGAAFPLWPLIRGPLAKEAMNLMNYVSMKKNAKGCDRYKSLA